MVTRLSAIWFRNMDRIFLPYFSGGCGNRLINGAVMWKGRFSYDFVFLIYIIERNSVCLSVCFNSEATGRTTLKLNTIDHLSG